MAPTTHVEFGTTERQTRYVEWSTGGPAGLDGWWALKWEATDLYPNIFDTSSLSVVRGGSMMYDLVGRSMRSLLGDLGAAPNTFRIVYAAASEALVLVQGDGDRVRKLGRGLVEALAKRPWWRPSAVAVCRASEVVGQGGSLKREGLDGLARQVLASRLAQFDLAVLASAEAETDWREVDAFDGVRPVSAAHDDCLVYTAAAAGRFEADRPSERKEYHHPIHAMRFRLGQRGRFGLLNGAMNRWRTDRWRTDSGQSPKPSPCASWSLKAWAKNLDNARTSNPWGSEGQAFRQDFASVAAASEMSGYMAVIDADVAGLGAWRRELTSAKSLALASLAIEEALERALARALAPELELMDAWSKAGWSEGAPKWPQVAQLLTLAGDEWVMMLPAHRAASFLKAFTSAWPWACGDLKDKAKAAADDQLGELFDSLGNKRWRFGVVVAHHATPIQHLRDAAHDLQENARHAPEGEHAVDWAVLKSHDVPPDGILAQRARMCAPAGHEDPSGSKDATARPQTVAQFHATAHAALALGDAGLPQRQLKRCVGGALKAVRGGKAREAAASLDSRDARDALEEAAADPAVRKWLELADSDPRWWVDLNELMEVVSPVGDSVPYEADSILRRLGDRPPASTPDHEGAA